jgi:hypothetical protein
MAREGIRQLGILKGLMSFNNLQQDIRKVEYIGGSRIICRSCFGEDVVYIYTEKKEEEKVSRGFYVYVTISNYVTIWNSQTGEVAEGICNNEGEIYDEEGNPLITFPCHKDELVKWLEGIPNKPTRQVLKDAPEDNRDYMDDNGKDIGNEHRIEKAHPDDPSYDDYFGLIVPAYFDNHDNWIVDHWNPYCCYTPGCEAPYMEDAMYLSINKKTMPRPSSLFNCDLIECEESFTLDRHGKGLLRDVRMKTYYSPYRRCRYADCGSVFDGSVYNRQTQQWYSKNIFLCNYPSPIASIWIDRWEQREYTSRLLSRYPEAIKIAQDDTYVDDTCRCLGDDWNFNYQMIKLSCISLRSGLGDILVDLVPNRDWREDRKRLYEITSDGDFSKDTWSYYQIADLANNSLEWEVRSELGGSCCNNSHAQDGKHWVKFYNRNTATEDIRTGICWCGSPWDYHTQETEEPRRWYRVILNFHMSIIHTRGGEGLHCCGDGEFDYPHNQAACDACNDLSSGCCNIEYWDDEPGLCFSSVQATVELTNPEEYPKDRNDTITRTIFEDGHVDEDGTPINFVFDKTTKLYKRPDNYEGHEEDFTELCAYPGRTQGYPENEENDICYPFDGTYDIYTLGKAVEELINNHYEDGSDDQLSVYLYKRNI